MRFRSNHFTVTYRRPGSIVQLGVILNDESEKQETKRAFLSRAQGQCENLPSLKTPSDIKKSKGLINFNCRKEKSRSESRPFK